MIDYIYHNDYDYGDEVNIARSLFSIYTNSNHTIMIN